MVLLAYVVDTDCSSSGANRGCQPEAVVNERDSKVGFGPRRRFTFGRHHTQRSHHPLGEVRWPSDVDEADQSVISGLKLEYGVRFESRSRSVWATEFLHPCRRRPRISQSGAKIIDRFSSTEFENSHVVKSRAFVQEPEFRQASGYYVRRLELEILAGNAHDVRLCRRCGYAHD